MSERKKPRLALIGLVAVALIGSAAFYFLKTDHSNASEALDKAKSSQKLQSLAELDGKAPAEAHGTDVAPDGSGSVTEQRLYQLVRQSGDVTDRTFSIEFLDPGVSAYAFTFG